MGPANITGSRIIFFIRHGHYEYSVPEEYIEMTDLGKLTHDIADITVLPNTFAVRIINMEEFWIKISI